MYIYIAVKLHLPLHGVTLCLTCTIDEYDHLRIIYVVLVLNTFSDPCTCSIMHLEFHII